MDADEEEGSSTKDQGEEPPAYDPDGLITHLKRMKAEDRDDFMDRVMLLDGHDQDF